MQPGAGGKLTVIFAVTIVLLGFLVTRSVQQEVSRPEADEVVVYCAHDLPFVEPLIAEFEEQTGINVTLVADTEASKSLGLTRRIEAERNRPAADVFWNNQLLGTIDLAKKGLFASHADVEERSRFPEQFRDEAGLWTAFGARLRVWILSSPDLIESTSEAMPIDPDFCMADPMFGTTLTHAAVLWSEQGGEEFRQWFDSLPGRGVRVVPGNSATRDLVAGNVCTRGWTDTDDYAGAVDRGASVAMAVVRTAENRTIAIPNSVAILRKCRHPKTAKRFVAWLLSEEVERKLAEGDALQVPLGTLSEQPLPDRVAELRPFVEDAIDLRPFVDARREVLDWLGGR